MFGTNALETQLDLLYAYCQFELERRFAGRDHVTLYRGIELVDQRDLVASRDRRRHVILLNNLTSFTAVRERAEEFGHFILKARVPLAKVTFFDKLLGRGLSGEAEHMVIGGLYEVSLSSCSLPVPRGIETRRLSDALIAGKRWVFDLEYAGTTRPSGCITLTYSHFGNTLIR